MGPDSDFKSHLAYEISSFSSRTVSCPHRHFSPPFIDWYRLFGVRFFSLFLLWGFFIFFPSLLIHSHRSNKMLQSISFVADILSLVGFVLFLFSYLSLLSFSFCLCFWIMNVLLICSSPTSSRQKLTPQGRNRLQACLWGSIPFIFFETQLPLLFICSTFFFFFSFCFLEIFPWRPITVFSFI